jgi:hypothetical protein
MMDIPAEAVITSEIGMAFSFINVLESMAHTLNIPDIVAKAEDKIPLTDTELNFLCAYALTASDVMSRATGCIEILGSSILGGAISYESYASRISNPKGVDNVVSTTAP